MKAYLLATLAASLLAACSVTADLTKDSSFLSEDDRAVARRIAEQAQLRCATYVYELGSGTRLSGDVKMALPPEILKLSYSPDTTWFMAYGVGQGAWGNFYYDRSTGRFVCGENAWARFERLRNIKFIELKQGESSRSAVPSGLRSARDARVSVAEER